MSGEIYKKNTNRSEMANLKEKIQDLLKNTTSQEVKVVCESFLKEADGKDVNPTDRIAESLFSNLKSYVDKDSQVGALLNEREGYAKSIMDIESQISKNAAQRLSENWDANRRDKKISNVGNLMDNTLKAENIEKAAQGEALLEKLSTIDDASAKKFIDKSKVDSYSLKESIQDIKGSQIANHPNLKYVIAKFESSLMENTPEHLLVSDFLSQINGFKWDPTIKKATEKIQESINSKAAELQVQNTISAIKATDHKRFFTDIVGRMNEWVYSENKNVHDLVKEMKGYMFNPHVKDLAHKLMLMENSKGTQFNIPVKDSNCSVSKIYSPVYAAVNGQVFRAGNNFYHATDSKFAKLSEAQINALPKEYLELCESFFNPSVKVSDDSITVYLGNTKFRFDGEKRIFVNERQIDATTLGSQLMFHTQQTIFRDTSNMANVAMNIYENLDNICEIDYGKSIMSNVFEGVGVYLFKRDDKVFINKMNPSMNENVFVKANALQTVNLVKEFLSFNMSESLAEFLEGDYKKKALMEGEMNQILSSIQLLEAELDKIEKAILEDPSFADVKEIADAKTLIENELNSLKSKWSESSEELKKFETVSENDEEEEEVEIIEEPKAKDDENKGDDEDQDQDNDDDNGDKDPDGGEPKVEAEENTGVDPVTPVEAPQATTGVVDTGLLGAEGAQATATIPGNDHLDSNAQNAAAPSGEVLNTGFAGAEGAQQANNGQMATDIKTDTAATPVLTPGPADAAVIPGQAAPSSIPVSVTPAAGEATPVANATAEVSVNAPDAPAADDAAKAGDEGNKDAEKVDAVVVDVKKEEEVKENQNILAESIGVDSKVKDKVSGKTGTVTAMSDEKFTVLLDDGEPVERTLSDLEDVAQEIEQNVMNNEQPVDKEKAAPAETADDANENENADDAANAGGQEGADTEKEEAMFVKATLTIDLGPFKAGDSVEIDAANYTSGGDDDAIKLKEPKDGVSEIPKKYLSVVNDNSAEGGDDADAKVAAVLQQIQDLETFLNDENTKGSKAIEDAKAKIKKFAASLDKKDEPKADDKSGEEAK